MLGRQLDPEARQWVEATLEGLSLEELCGQVCCVGGGSDDAVVDRLCETWPRVPVGGIFTWHGSLADHRRRIAGLQTSARIPLLVASDLESGPASIVDAPQFPDALAIAAAGNPEWAYAAGECAARFARACGINWTFAPVVDLNLNPDNPITNTRSWGDQPDRVIPLAAAFLHGVQDNGLAACAKHFPGDGTDDVDQHVATSVNRLSLEEWKRLHGRVFAAMIGEGVATIMIGHIAFPAWDPENCTGDVPCPATLSQRITTRLLRQEMGFRGLITSDDMNMGGVAGCLGRPERTLAILEAGCDLLLLAHVPEDFETLLRAVRSGRLKVGRLRASVRRILQLKAALGLHRGASWASEPAAADRARWQEVAEKVARASVHCVRNERGVLPLRRLRSGSRILTVTMSLDDSKLPVVEEELRRRGFQVDHLRNPADCDFFHKARRYDAVFVNLAIKAAWCSMTVRCVGPRNLMFMNSFYREHPAAVFTSFGSPYHLRSLRNLPTYLNVYSDSAPSQRAAVAAWLGEIQFAGGRPPVRL
ncbi:MAG TPA: glycoside hydrolase family 3 protein [Kiritimatiellae bacterium]|nr:glycoside hydrolase family 3 protein [Kiritimatiellia bacterium]